MHELVQCVSLFNPSDFRHDCFAMRAAPAILLALSILFTCGCDRSESPSNFIAPSATDRARRLIIGAIYEEFMDAPTNQGVDGNVRLRLDGDEQIGEIVASCKYLKILNATASTPFLLESPDMCAYFKSSRIYRSKLLGVKRDGAITFHEASGVREFFKNSHYSISEFRVSRAGPE